MENSGNRNNVADDADRGWVPKNRPQSTMARNFSAALDDLFKMDSDLDSLSKNVHQKKQEVSTRTQELEALEARLRATEERLKRAGKDPTDLPSSRKNSQRRTPVKDAFSNANTTAGAANSPSASPSNMNKWNAEAAQRMPGAMPDTPKSYDSRQEYIMVDGANRS